MESIIYPQQEKKYKYAEFIFQKYLKKKCASKQLSPIKSSSIDCRAVDRTIVFWTLEN